MIVRDFYEINGRQFVRTYSDAGRYVVGGNPEGQYTEANDPADAGRTYTEGELIFSDDADAGAEEVLDILLGGESE